MVKPIVAVPLAGMDWPAFMVICNCAPFVEAVHLGFSMGLLVAPPEMSMVVRFPSKTRL